MLDLKHVINFSSTVKASLASRRFDTSLIDEIITIAQKRSMLMVKIQTLEARRNTLSRQIGEIKAARGDATKELAQVAKIKTQIEKIKNDEITINETIKNKMLVLPNLPHAHVPLGVDETENKVILERAKLGRGLVKQVRPHYDVATELGIIDFERAVKMSGARFWAYVGLGARLVRALEQMMLDYHVANGYTEVRPPVIVSAKTMQGTGQLPKFKEDLFKLESLDAFLIPTAEVPLTNFHAGEIINLDAPIAYTAFTPCFRAEAGSGGRDMRGIIRSHQFNKVELVKITSHDDLARAFTETLKDASAILEMLELPYRQVQLCTGDLGFSAEETIDLEVWIPSEKRYREISSVSRCGDFQGRRAGIRYKDKNGQNVAACTINGSALAIDRTIAAILENYQNADGSITVPQKLVPYMMCERITMPLAKVK